VGERSIHHNSSPLAAPATQARSTTSAGKVALEPLGIIPYDGRNLPRLSPDDGSVTDAPYPPLDPRIESRISGASATLRDTVIASVSSEANDALLFFDPRSARMAAWFPDDPAPLPLAAGSIAGCWASTASSPAVLLTTSDGLYLERLTQHSTGWRTEPPVRLLREPYVPRATTHPDRPYILIGPAPATSAEPFRLQLLAMKILEE
jgi:hypothetical protein